MDTIDTSKHFSRYGVCVLYSLYSKMYYYASSTVYSQCTVQRGMKAACSKALLLNGFTPFKEKKKASDFTAGNSNIQQLPVPV